MKKLPLGILALIQRKGALSKMWSVALMLVGCASLAVAGDATVPKPEALSDETIYLTRKISANYDTLLIKAFSSDGVAYNNVNDEEKSKIVQMLPLLRSTITLSLEAELKAKKIFRKVFKSAAASGKVVILEGSFTELDAGSPTLKFFGGGKPSIRFKGKLIDGATGKDLATFEDREKGFSESLSTDSFEDLFPYQAKNIGATLAVFLEKLY